MQFADLPQPVQDALQEKYELERRLREKGINL